MKGPKGGGGGEDELPERLKGCDPKLVEAIRNGTHSVCVSCIGLVESYSQYFFPERVHRQKVPDSLNSRISSP